METKHIPIAKIDRSKRLRAINPTWAQTLADEARETGPQWPAIEVVETAKGYRLVSGGHRTAAAELLGLTEIEAKVFGNDEFADEASIRLREIRENMLRYELTALDRAVHLATWKEIHESVAGPAKRGRKSRQEELAQNSAAIFAGTFSKAAATALGISERSVQVAVQVACSITEAVRHRISAHSIADTMSELIQLAGETPDRQDTIAGMLLAEPPLAHTVAEAIALIDKLPAPKKLEKWEAAAARFGRLTLSEQDRFFEANSASVDRSLAARSNGRKAA